MQRSETAAPASSNASFTPGPWGVTATDPTGKSEWFDIHADRTKRQDRHYIGAVNGPHNDTQRANAHLIAAAPDLYEALKDAIDHIEHMAKWIGNQNAGYSFESLGEDMSNFRDALKKAEGRS